MLRNIDLPLRIEHSLVRFDDVQHNLLVHRLGGGRGAGAGEIGATNLPLHFERVECSPRTGEARGEVADRLGAVQIVQREVVLRKLALPQPRPEGVYGVVTARDVFREVEMWQQLGARHRGRGPGLLATGVRHRSRGILSQCLIDSLA
jgi:hypothetical protein